MKKINPNRTANLLSVAKQRGKVGGLFILLMLVLHACRPEPPTAFDDTPYDWQLPVGFPTPPEPEDNTATAARVQLGKLLFYDPILSRNSSLACASCHLPELAFTDGEVFSKGMNGLLTERNSPALVNLAYAPAYMRDGGVSTLEVQVAAPIKAHNEMDFDILPAVERLKRQPKYVDLSAQAYDRSPDAFVLTRALGAFQRTLVSGNSPFDRYFYGDKSALSAAQKEGMHLFFSEEVGCAKCHGGFNFTNNQYENNGLYSQFTDGGRYQNHLGFGRYREVQGAKSAQCGTYRTVYARWKCAKFSVRHLPLPNGWAAPSQ